MNFDKKLRVIFEDLDTGFKTVSEQEANNFLKTEANQYKQPQLVYTEKPSDAPDGDYLIVEPLNRELSYKGRYHALIIDAFEKWQDFPQRGNGIVGTTSTTGNGNFYAVIPENGANMGISAKKSIMDSFPNVAVNFGIKFENFNNALNMLLNIFNNAKGTYDLNTKKITKSKMLRYDGNYETFKKAIEKVDNTFVTNEATSVLNEIVSHPYNKQTENDVISLIEFIKSKKTTFSLILDELFDPYENGFEIISFEKFISGNYKERDIWLDNKCLLVKESVFGKLQFANEEQPQKAKEVPPQNNAEEASNDPLV